MTTHRVIIWLKTFHSTVFNLKVFFFSPLPVQFIFLKQWMLLGVMNGNDIFFCSQPTEIWLSNLIVNHKNYYVIRVMDPIPKIWIYKICWNVLLFYFRSNWPWIRSQFLPTELMNTLFGQVPCWNWIKFRIFPGRVPIFYFFYFCCCTR